MVEAGVKRRIRESILKKRGLVPAPRRGLQQQEVAPPDERNLTLVMRQLETRFDTSIEELLDYGNLVETAMYLGVGPSTVSLWRLRLGLRGRKYVGTPHAGD